MKEGVVSPAGSSWSYGCYAVAETCSPGQTDCADHPTEPGGHGIEPSPESPATPPFPWNTTFLKACQTHHTPIPDGTFVRSYQSMLSIHLLRYWRMSIGNMSSYSWSTCSRYLQSNIWSWPHWDIFWWNEGDSGRLLPPFRFNQS